ncbi:MAG: cellulase-like family protein [Bryobacteraceae bacterium]
MDRRSFLAGSVVGLAAAAQASGKTAAAQSAGSRLHNIQHPLAITMWDFSWLERRWPGAGYEDWDLALDGLALRGYDAVRIDAYPHLVASNPNATWELIPCWDTQDWGSPAKNKVQVQPALNQFIRKCGDRKLRVGLSTWFRHDPDQTLMRIQSPEDLGRIWKVTLDSIARDGLLPNILYVDLCNEWPLDVWAPFLPKGFKRTSAENTEYMKRAIQVVRSAYPDLDYTFSQTSEFDEWKQQDVSMFDFMEPHIWMAQADGYYDAVGYHYERFDPQGYKNLVDNAKRVYLEKRDHWDRKLVERIEMCADWSRASGKPLITTECWSLVDYKDWPLLEWDWPKQLCELGVRTAAGTGRWVAIATSNFTGPQFAGMWRDVEWHRKMTNIIHSASFVG